MFDTIIEGIGDNLFQIISTVVTGIIGYLGIRIKNLYQEYIKDKTKKEIIEKTVRYIEQIYKDSSCEEKKVLALQKSLEWLKEKHLTISDTELEILVESSVNCIKK